MVETHNDSSGAEESFAAMFEESLKREDIKEELLARLTPDTDARIRCTAIIALGQMQTNDSRIVNTLFDALTDSDASVRQEAVSAFKDIKTREDHILKAILARLSDDEYFVREAAATTLGCLNEDHFADEDLTRTVLEDPDLDVRLAAIKALKRKALEKVSAIDNISSELVEKLRPLLHTEPSMAEHVVSILGHVGASQPEIIQELLDYLAKPAETNVIVRQAIVRALKDANVKQLAIFESFVRILADIYADFTLREETIEALTKLCTRHPPSIQELRSIISKRESDIHMPWIEGPIRQATDIYTQELVKEAVSRCLDILDKIGSSQTQIVDQLLMLLLCPTNDIHKDKSIIQQTIRVLSGLETNDSRIPDCLVRILSDPETTRDIRKETISALSHIGKRHPYTLERMINALSDENTVGKRAIVEALGTSSNIGCDKVINALLTLLNSKNTLSIDREEAIRALSTIGDQNLDVINALRSILSESDPDPDPSIRQVAATALGNIGYKHIEVAYDLLRILGVPPLTRVEPVLSVRKAAAIALARAEVGEAQEKVIDSLHLLYKLYGLYSHNFFFHPSIRSDILSTLFKLGGNDRRVLQTFVKQLTDSSLDVLLKTEIAITVRQARISDTSIIEALRENLFNATSSILRQEVATTLGIVCKQNDHILTDLFKALSDDLDPSVRREVTIALGNMSTKDQAARERIHTILLSTLSDTDTDPVVKREAAFALININRDSNQPPELLVLDTILSFLLHSDEAIREKAVRALDQPSNNQPRVIQALWRALRDEEHVRIAAAYALGHLRSDDVNTCTLLSDDLERYAPIARQKMTTEDADTIDVTLKALCQAVRGP